MVKLYIMALVLTLTFSKLAFANILTVDAYRDSQLVNSRSQVNEVVSVPLGTIRRSGSGWEPESVKRVQGDYLTTLHRVNRSADIDAIYSHYRSQLVTDSRTVLFECSSRSCGSSNAWANEFFNDYLLNGADNSQFLLVVKDRQELYQVLYINRRGAGDVMVRLDQVRSTDSYGTEANIVAQMDANDTPSIRRFVRDLPSGQNVIGFVTSGKTGSMGAIESGDRLIRQIEIGLGDQLVSRVRFINIADLGIDSLGVDRVSFVLESR